MEKKIKFILIGVGVAFLGLLIMLFSSLGAKHNAERERDKLMQENTSQAEKINQFNQEVQDWKKRSSDLTQEYERVTREKVEIGKKYDFAEKARAGLLDELKALKVQKDQMQKDLAAQKEQTQKVITPVEGPSSGLQANEAYWARILKAKTDVEFQLESVRSELKTLKISNEQLQREKTVLDLEITNLSRDGQDLKRQLEYNQKLMDSMAQELVREKNDKLEIQGNFKQFKSENTVLRKQLSSLNNRKITLERKLQEQQEKNSELKAKLGTAEAIAAEKSSWQMASVKEEPAAKPVAEAGQQENAVELAPIVVRPPQTETAVSAPSAVQGKVLAVNKDNNFVIIDQGEEEGVKLGDTFHAERNGKVIGSLEAIQVRRAISACDIKRETTVIKVGDTVR